MYLIDTYRALLPLLTCKEHGSKSSFLYRVVGAEGDAEDVTLGCDGWRDVGSAECPVAWGRRLQPWLNFHWIIVTVLL